MTTSLKSVFIVTKPTFYEYLLEVNDKRLLGLIESGDENTRRTLRAHEAHHRSLELVRFELRLRGIDFVELSRDNLKPLPDTTDLVISVGGDGTFLSVSHQVGTKTRILGVNSAPESSHGHYCVADAANFAAVLDEILSGTRKTVRLSRLQLVLAGKALPELVLNEVLIADASPAGSSRYKLQVDNAVELQLSSGLLVATAAGSTGSIRSAGGRVLPIASTRFQYRVRDPFVKPGGKTLLRQGVVPRTTRMHVVSDMQDGRLFIDGKNLVYDFPRGEHLTIVSSRENDLIAYVNRDCHQRY